MVSGAGTGLKRTNKQRDLALTGKTQPRAGRGGVPGLSLLLPKHLQSGQAVRGLPWGHKSDPQLFVGIGTIAND